MAGTKNRKLCWNCEGSVHMHATKCPYCGTDLSSENSPTYSFGKQVQAPPPPYTPPADLQPPPLTPEPQALEGPKKKGEFLPMLLLLPGAFFLFFGMILLFFSNDGTLSLEWNAHYWFFYLLLSAPLIYYGWRTLSRQEPTPEPAPIRHEDDTPSPWV